MDCKPLWGSAEIAMWWEETAWEHYSRSQRLQGNGGSE